MNKLLIVGNGFDIAHGLHTRYWDFRKYLEENHLEFLMKLENMYSIYNELYEPYDYYSVNEYETFIEDTFWANFECNVGKPNIEEMLNFSANIVEELTNDVGTIGIEDTLNVCWKDEYGFIGKLQNYVMEWIEEVDTNGIQPKKQELIGDNDRKYFSFNYTDTLENVYHINNVMHIHGSIERISEVNPIIGHCNKCDIQKYENETKQDRERFVEGKGSIYQAIVDYLRSTYKNTEEIIFMQNEYFEELGNVDFIEIIGWSIGEVDIPYLKKIYESVREEAEWYIYFHDDKLNENIYETLTEVGIKGQNIVFQRDVNFWD